MSRWSLGIQIDRFDKRRINEHFQCARAVNRGDVRKNVNAEDTLKRNFWISSSEEKFELWRNLNENHDF